MQLGIIGGEQVTVQRMVTEGGNEKLENVAYAIHTGSRGAKNKI